MEGERCKAVGCIQVEERDLNGNECNLKCRSLMQQEMVRQVGLYGSQLK